MQNKDDLSMNMNAEDDFTLPNLEEGLNIDKIPSIEDLISLDKDEIEKIQKTEIAEVFNDNKTDTSKVFEENIDPPLTTQENNDSLDMNTSFDRDFDSMNLFDEDVDLTLDEPANANIDNENLNISEDNNLLLEEPEIVEDNDANNTFENMTPDITFEDTNDILFDNKDMNSITNEEMPTNLDQQEINFNENDNLSFEPEIIEDTHDDGINMDISNTEEENTSIQENFEDDSFDYSLDNNIYETEQNENIENPEENNQIETYQEEIPADDSAKEFSFETEDTDNVETQDTEEKADNEEEEMPNLNSVEKETSDISETTDETLNNSELSSPAEDNENNIYTGTTKHYSANTDVFAKIDSLLNDDSAFETDYQPPSSFNDSALSSNTEQENSFDEMPKPKYKSSFDPSKYMKKSHKVTLSDDTEEKLGLLYTARKVFDNIKTLKDDLNIGDQASLSSFLQNENNKKALIAAAVCVIVLGAGITGISLFNNKSVEEINTLNNTDISTPLETTANNVQTPQPQDTINPPLQTNPSTPLIDENSKVSSSDVPELDKKPPAEVKQDVVQETITQQTKPPINPESYLTVKKIQWQVPDYLSYSPNIKSYLQSAGKSIKLSLSSDLLLATEYAYSNVVKINIKLNNSGIVQNASVATSSGSKQIDNIVLQSVKTTLNVVKPPAGEVKTPDFNLTLTIYL